MRTTLTEHAQDSVSSQQDCFTFKKDPLHQNAIRYGNIKILSYDVKSTGQYCQQKVINVNQRYLHLNAFFSRINDFFKLKTTVLTDQRVCILQAGL